MTFRSILFVALFGVGLASLTATARAEAFSGTFTLPFEAHWGSAVLPAGTYMVSADVPLASSVIKVVGNGTSAMILAGPSRPRDFSSNGNIELREINGTYVVTKFTAGTAGKEFQFAVPKAIRAERASTSQLVTVPVSNQN